MRLWVWSPEPMKNPTYGRKHYNEYWAASQPEAAPWGSLASSTGLVCEPQDTMRELKKTRKLTPREHCPSIKIYKERKERRKEICAQHHLWESTVSKIQEFWYIYFSFYSSFMHYIQTTVSSLSSLTSPPTTTSHLPQIHPSSIPRQTKVQASQGYQQNTAQQVTVRLGANPLKKDGWDNPVGEKGFQE